MRLSAALALGGLVMLAGAVLFAPAQAPVSKGPETRAAPRSPPLQVPPGAIVAVYESTAEALRQVPRAILLSPEKFRELLEDLERLRKQLERASARSPTKCSIKGKVAGHVATLSITFEFATEAPGETIALGGGLAHATGASLNGRTPRLSSGLARPRALPVRPADDTPEGLYVEVDRAGEHVLTLDLVAVVASKAGTQSLTLDLPRAAITKLALELPAGAGEVRLAGKALADTLLAHQGKDVAGPLGPIDKLELSWRPARAGPADAVLASEGAIVTEITATELKTDAQLRLRPLAGTARQWRLLVPPRAKVEVAQADQDRVAKIDTAAGKLSSLVTVQLKAESSDPLTVRITTAQPAPRPGSGASGGIGPFSVVGAAKQSGTVLVRNHVADWHLHFTAHGDLTRRALTDDEQKKDASLVAAFRYGVAAGDELRRRGLPWLDLETERVRGKIKVRLAHALSLTAGPSGSRWQVQTALTVTPGWVDLDRLKVELPAGCELNEDGSYPLPERVRGLSYDPARRIVELRLNPAPAGAALQPFTVRVEGAYSTRVGRAVAGKASLELPHAPGTIEEGRTVTVTLPSELELVTPSEGQPAGLEVVRHSTHEATYRASPHAPRQLAVAWRPYRPPVRAASVVDLTLGPGEASVRHELRYHLPPAGPTPRLMLRVPAAVLPGLRVERGGKLVEVAAEPGLDRVVTLIPADVRQPAFVLHYALPLPARPEAPVAFPLLAPEQVTEAECKVRVWAEPGSLPMPAGKGWAEQNIEDVPGRDRFPALVLRATRPNEPLRLHLAASGEAPAVLIERGLVRVDVSATGAQTYRVSYRLSRLAARWLDLELPAPAATINLQITLGGKRLDHERIASDQPELAGRRVRLRLAPGLVNGPTTLDITYQLTPDRLGSTALATTLQGPRVIGETAGAVPTRWLVTTPPNWALLTPEAAPGTPRSWGWAGWLLAPRISLNAAELERWLLGGDGPISEGAAEVVPSLLLWRDGGARIQLTHVPRQAWLLACSLTLVLVMLLLGRLARSTERGRAVAWALGAGLVLVTLAAVLLWPHLAAQAASACQPGAAVLLVVGLVQWVAHERERRQLVFLPSFSRPVAGSSQARPEPPRPHGEPSTVDAPRPVGSSVERRP